MLNVEFLKDLRNCENLYQHYPNVSEEINKKVEFNINYVTYEYCCLYYDNLLCYENTNIDYFYFGVNK